MADVTIEARPNGPYVVIGTIEMHDTSGAVLPTQARTVLCRCGASTQKPFCDGTHSKIGFQAAAQAVPGSAEDAAGSGTAGISAGGIAVPAAALDNTESAGVISGVDPAGVEKGEAKASQSEEWHEPAIGGCYQIQRQASPERGDRDRDQTACPPSWKAASLAKAFQVARQRPDVVQVTASGSRPT
jgi:CDGSH-type Zn-finger protein